MSLNYAPITIFCFKRLNLTKRLINSLKKNKISKFYPIFFFIDYPKYENQKKDVKKLIKYVKSIKFFRNKKIIIRNENFGIKKNISMGVEHVLDKFEKIIVLEDDLEINNDFVFVMNKLLNIHKYNNEVYTITGYSPLNNKSKQNLIEDFFICKRPSSWGWATWKKKWYYIKNNKSKFNYKGEYGNDLILMKKKEKINNLNSWAYKWTLSHMVKKKYCLYPKFSMVKNNGFDTNSTNNFFGTKKFHNKIYNYKIKNFKNYHNESINIKKIFKSFYDEKKIIFIFKFIYYEAKKILNLF